MTDRAGRIEIKNNEPIAPYTTLGLGGQARFFAVAHSADQLREALLFARERGLHTYILGGGSNIIVPDDGYSGLMVKVALRGIAGETHGESTEVTAAAGEMWDPFVRYCIDHHLAGVECLSGIPGFVGATPIQNVGAYGQEVRETLVSISAIDRRTLESVRFTNIECRFGYRQSRFKSEDADRFIITDVTFRLTANGRPVIKYPELKRHLETSHNLDDLDSGRPVLDAVRTGVLALRIAKSMVVDPSDPHSRSVGSFFMNPILTHDEFASLQGRWASVGTGESIPSFLADDAVKIPAAWLIEHAGFAKGYRKGGVGISPHHSLALVNYGGSTAELLVLAGVIQDAVFNKFGITLQREPVIVS
ncbi:MAG TPA: UDP-N-acetylmuramate dehydrogenase [Bacteroidota bacterium]|nr:UDP-N-acetylmuramate dehydrogenase [Bacteroidota bacterium]